MGLLLVPIAYVVVQSVSLANLSGRWRIAAALPVPVMIVAVINSAVGYANEANLWPVPVLLGSLCMLVYLGGLWALMRLLELRDT